MVPRQSRPKHHAVHVLLILKQVDKSEFPVPVQPLMEMDSKPICPVNHQLQPPLTVCIGPNPKNCITSVWSLSGWRKRGGKKKHHNLIADRLSQIASTVVGY